MQKLDRTIEDYEDLTRVEQTIPSGAELIQSQKNTDYCSENQKLFMENEFLDSDFVMNWNKNHKNSLHIKIESHE